MKEYFNCNLKGYTLVVTWGDIKLYHTGNFYQLGDFICYVKQDAFIYNKIHRCEYARRIIERYINDSSDPIFIYKTERKKLIYKWI